MSEKAVNQEQTASKKPVSKVFIWTAGIFTVLLLEAGAIFGAVKISESQNHLHSDQLRELSHTTEALMQRLNQLENFRKDIMGNREKIAGNSGEIQLLSEKLASLTNEVGNRKIEILNQQMNGLHHRMEAVEETKSNEALILSVALLIKENVLYNRDFMDEISLLKDLAREQTELSAPIQTLEELKDVRLLTNAYLTDTYHKIIDGFSFTAPEEQEADELQSIEKQGTIAKSLELIKDSVSGINFDKIVVIKKEKRTDEQKQLISHLSKLIDEYNFSEALAFFNKNPLFKDAQNEALNAFMKNIENKISFDKALSAIITAELSALRQDFQDVAAKASANDK